MERAVAQAVCQIVSYAFDAYTACVRPANESNDPRERRYHVEVWDRRGSTAEPGEMLYSPWHLAKWIMERETASRMG